MQLLLQAIIRNGVKTVNIENCYVRISLVQLNTYQKLSVIDF